MFGAGFLSTPSARRATSTGIVERRAFDEFLSTPSARRATKNLMDRWSSRWISIHALREEGDTPTGKAAGSSRNFYPRPPRGGRRRNPYAAADGDFISIHALREEGDATSASRRSQRAYFYPRPPRGGRRASRLGTTCAMIFLSTPSARRATGNAFSMDDTEAISIHALREEGDSPDSDGAYTIV